MVEAGEPEVIKAELVLLAMGFLKPEHPEYPENVFVCGPCWWGTFPMAIFTQLEKLDWTGKKVMAVMTHEGSGLGGSERSLKEICKGASFGKGFSVAGHDAARSEVQVAAWAKSQV